MTLGHSTMTTLLAHAIMSLHQSRRAHSFLYAGFPARQIRLKHPSASSAEADCGTNGPHVQPVDLGQCCDPAEGVQQSPNGIGALPPTASSNAANQHKEVKMEDNDTADSTIEQVRLVDHPSFDQLPGRVAFVEGELQTARLI
ncbi:hypothetical protein BAUCODRAFT_128267 [Baudoinia panamericana UAMH 10762]|uniref:Uncharacterized protein n=1 Tax=Baudoinia panamericana (strain UAMH 10762) TaxID=717646 RepID=M2LXK5_BAUPA|nr:uncharacterized protein BAUCODRAFT_128267 [Baudoinia panamericana UAMH 10762]EMC99427.1 hypothetical protein BAUCODRAFT_128267 [Baudoinia panamericana UAMH 10762]